MTALRLAAHVAAHVWWVPLPVLGALIVGPALDRWMP